MEPALDYRALSGVMRGRIVEVIDEGRACVTELGDRRRLTCVPLTVAEGVALTLAVGDDVLIHGADDEEAGVVLGRFGPSREASTEAVRSDAPEELVIEATKSLTLRVGSGSITIREDGKILIKGKDLVSHAKRLNRIRGGSVQIN